jgi:hypothetical protein
VSFPGSTATKRTLCVMDRLELTRGVTSLPPGYALPEKEPHCTIPRYSMPESVFFLLECHEVRRNYFEDICLVIDLMHVRWKKRWEPCVKFTSEDYYQLGVVTVVIVTSVRTLERGDLLLHYAVLQFLACVKLCGCRHEENSITNIRLYRVIHSEEARD